MKLIYLLFLYLFNTNASIESSDESINKDELNLNRKKILNYDYCISTTENDHKNFEKKTSSSANFSKDFNNINSQNNLFINYKNNDANTLLKTFKNNDDCLKVNIATSVELTSKNLMENSDDIAEEVIKDQIGMSTFENTTKTTQDFMSENIASTSKNNIVNSEVMAIEKNIKTLSKNILSYEQKVAIINEIMSAVSSQNSIEIESILEKYDNLVIDEEYKQIICNYINSHADQTTIHDMNYDIRNNYVEQSSDTFFSKFLNIAKFGLYFALLFTMIFGLLISDVYRYFVLFIGFIWIINDLSLFLNIAKFLTY